MAITDDIFLVERPTADNVAIVGGGLDIPNERNAAAGAYSCIIAGHHNNVSGAGSVIVGGSHNNLTGANSIMLGCHDLTVDEAGVAYIDNVRVEGDSAILVRQIGRAFSSLLNPGYPRNEWPAPTPVGVHPLALAVLESAQGASYAYAGTPGTFTGPRLDDWRPVHQKWRDAGYPVAPGLPTDEDEAALLVALDAGLALVDEPTREAAARALMKLQATKPRK